MNNNRKIQKFISRLQAWVFVRHLIHKLIQCAPAGILAGAVFEIISYFTPWYSVHAWAAGAVCASLAVAFVWAVISRPDRKKSALILDQTGLKERTVTALELLHEDGFFAEIQKKDTLDSLSQISVSKRLPVRIGRKRILVPALLGAVLVISALAPSPAKQTAKTTHEIAEKATAEEEKIEQVGRELAEEKESNALSEKELAEYQELLEQLQKELNEAKTQEQLDKTLERAEYKLSEAAKKTENTSVQKKMEQLASSLHTDSQKESSPDPEQLQNAKTQEQLAEKAEELLEQAESSEENGGLSEQELEELAKALEELAEEAENGELSEQLENAASLAKSGNLTSSQLASAKATVGAIKQQAQTVLAQNNSDNNGNSGKNNNSGNNNSGNNNNGSSNSDSNNGNGSDSGNGSGNGNGNGNGSGNGNGNGNGNGSGSGNGNGTGWNYGSKNGYEKDISFEGEKIAVPNQTGDDGNLTGSPSAGKNYASQGGPSLSWSGNSVNYEQVLGSYSKQAMSKVQGSNYPGGLQDIVKSYFEELNK